MPKQATCEIYQEMPRLSKWRWRLQSPNGRIVADGGQGYATYAGARRGFINAMNLGEFAIIKVVKA